MIDGCISYLKSCQSHKLWLEVYPTVVTQEGQSHIDSGYLVARYHIYERDRCILNPVYKYLICGAVNSSVARCTDTRNVQQYPIVKKVQKPILIISVL